MNDLNKNVFLAFNNGDSCFCKMSSYELVEEDRRRHRSSASSCGSDCVDMCRPAAAAAPVAGPARAASLAT